MENSNTMAARVRLEVWGFLFGVLVAAGAWVAYAWVQKPSGGGDLAGHTSPPPRESAPVMAPPGAQQEALAMEEALEMPARSKNGARQVANVDPRAVERYLSGAPLNEEAKARSLATLESLIEERHIQTSPDVLCRGDICRIVMPLGSKQELNKLIGARPGDGTEYFFHAQAEKSGVVFVLLYVTSVGTTFAELLS